MPSGPLSERQKKLEKYELTNNSTLDMMRVVGRERSSAALGKGNVPVSDHRQNWLSVTLLLKQERHRNGTFCSG
jgi:hypothetical protein